MSGWQLAQVNIGRLREPLDHPLVAMVPVSTRPEGQGDALGNHVSAMLVTLATEVDDPVIRLATIPPVHDSAVATVLPAVRASRTTTSSIVSAPSA